jgi:DNA primase small subunit
MSYSISPQNTPTNDQETADNAQMDIDGGASLDVKDSTMETRGTLLALDKIDENMTTNGVEVNGQKPVEVTITPGMKLEVKLEDLFADEDSDEEFSSSNQDMKAPSPPEVPSSPV